MKSYYCKKIDTWIEIDGNITKPVWDSIDEVLLYDTVTGDMPKQGTTAKMAWNEEFLYVLFSCEDNFINSTLTCFNDKLYEEEAVEIFIDDNRDLKTYIEIVVNPLNALMHYCVHDNLKGRFFGFARVDKEILTAVKANKTEGKWHVEMAIPFTEFITAPNVPPEPGDKWRMNLYRIDRPENGEDEYSAWSPTGKINFHIPERFGELVFCD